jgi:basic amino acid/polyamine antiporter, APA family
MTPVAGSAYAYTYATLGEGAAWLVGWCLLLEYMLSVSIVAIGWSGYTRAALHIFGVSLPPALSGAPFAVRHGHELVPSGSIIDLSGVLNTFVCTLIVLSGARTSANINSLVVLLKVLAILVVVMIGFGAVDPAHWVPWCRGTICSRVTRTATGNPGRARGEYVPTAVVPCRAMRGFGHLTAVERL